MLEDTIAAIATPLGEGSIGIVRLSGEDSLKILNKIFVSQKNKIPGEESFKLYYGHIINPENNELVDEVLVSVMKKPYTYTREDMIEINCHGGLVPLRETLKLVLRAGARPAEPGEFTKRAFLNGRIDLSQAESVIDVIRSKTEASLKVALNQLRGSLSVKVTDLQDKVLSLLAQTEAAIDFPEDEVEEGSREEMLEKSNIILKECRLLIQGAKKGKIFREGLKTVIVGRPNVGKSSLLNSMLQEERAIVTEVPGTTRDIIEENLNIRGVPLRLIDTAGLRETQDIVEKIGVSRSYSMLNAADLVLFVLDATRGITEEDNDLLKALDSSKTLVISNKIDLYQEKEYQSKKYFRNEILEEASLDEEDSLKNNFSFVEISALTHQGIDKLEEKILEMVLGGSITSSDSITISNIRHEAVLMRTAGYIEDFISSLENLLPYDIMSIDLRSAWESLGEITGSTVTEDLLDRIFNDFCIGK